MPSRRSWRRPKPAKRKRFTNLDAYDLFLHALAIMRTLTREGVDNALRLYSASIASDPEFAAAYAWAAMCYSIRKARNWLVVVTYKATRRFASTGSPGSPA